MICLFCELVAGRAPLVRLYEDEKTLSFMDIRPLVPGHALVIPKAHCLDLRVCPEDALGPLLKAAKVVGKAAVEATGSQGFNLIAANGAAAGQEVFHLHLHIFPRKDGDGFTRTSLVEHVRKAKVVTHAELRPLGEKIREAAARLDKIGSSSV